MYNKVSDEDAAQINKINKKPQRTKKNTQSRSEFAFLKRSSRVRFNSERINESMDGWSGGRVSEYSRDSTLEKPINNLGFLPWGHTSRERGGGG